MADISVCMIVRNEERNIARCLSSVKEYADEIIVVDTGSCDKTVPLCEEFGAKVFKMEWENDFSEARNYSLSKASGKWILILDADEEVKIADFNSFKNYLQQTADDLLKVKMRHYYGDCAEEENLCHTSSALRLFKNENNVRFEGKIHEAVCTDKSNLRISNIINPDIHIVHYGYMRSYMERKKNRNLSILLSEKETNRDNPWIYYHLSAEYYQLKDYRTSYEYINRAVIEFLAQNIMPPSLVYKLKYDILISTEKFETVCNSIEKAIELYSDYVDLYFYKGKAQFECKKYEEAIETFSYCLSIGDKSLKYLTLLGTGSFLALYYLGLCYKEKKMYPQAAKAYKQALAYYPKFNLAEERLTDIADFL